MNDLQAHDELCLAVSRVFLCVLCLLAFLALVWGVAVFG